MNSNGVKRMISLMVVMFSATALLVAGGAGDSKKKPVRVGSKFDTEGALLGNMILIVLESNGIEVVDKTELGPTDVVRKALEAREIDIYPEYTGNGNWFFTDNEYGDKWHDADGALAAVRELDKENNLVWLDPASANNTWAIAIREDLAQSANLKTMSDFAAYINGGGQVKLAGSEEFVSRPDGLDAFQREYGFKLESEQLLVVSSGNTSVTEQAAARGTDNVNAAMAYGTDGQLAAWNLMVLEDDKGVQLVYEPAPRMSSAVLSQYPQIKDLLNPVFMTLDLVTLQMLNAKIAVDGVPARQVAQEWLEKKGFAG